MMLPLVTALLGACVVILGLFYTCIYYYERNRNLNVHKVGYFQGFENYPKEGQSDSNHTICTNIGSQEFIMTYCKSPYKVTYV